MIASAVYWLKALNSTCAKMRIETDNDLKRNEAIMDGKSKSSIKKYGEKA